MTDDEILSQPRPEAPSYTEWRERAYQDLPKWRRRMTAEEEAAYLAQEEEYRALPEINARAAWDEARRRRFLNEDAALRRIAQDAFTRQLSLEELRTLSAAGPWAYQVRSGDCLSDSVISERFDRAMAIQANFQLVARYEAALAELREVVNSLPAAVVAAIRGAK